MENRSISEYALEVVCTRLDKINHRLVVVLLITIILLCVSNGAWLYAWMQYDYSDELTTEETVTLDAGDGGDANYSNNGGSVLNGKNNSFYKDYTPEKANEEE